MTIEDPYERAQRLYGIAFRRMERAILKADEMTNQVIQEDMLWLNEAAQWAAVMLALGPAAEIR